MITPNPKSNYLTCLNSNVCSQESPSSSDSDNNKDFKIINMNKKKECCNKMENNGLFSKKKNQLIEFIYKFNKILFVASLIYLCICLIEINYIITAYISDFIDYIADFSDYIFDRIYNTIIFKYSNSVLQHRSSGGDGLHQQ